MNFLIATVMLAFSWPEIGAIGGVVVGIASLGLLSEVDLQKLKAAKCIYVGISAGIAGPLLTTPGADFDDDRHLAVRAGYAVGGAIW